eukprot:TRINITY_DN4297_c0_g1_i2.p1 TRINITY_DN4297_c0_g1~~TRINITY_DN4297_c0_g1_i2.p1  ORF type:complete len:283 (+),score=48.62 TRINITY_DN4297_c0_g1_i2:14-862(+)
MITPTRRNIFMLGGISVFLFLMIVVVIGSDHLNPQQPHYRQGEHNEAFHADNKDVKDESKGEDLKELVSRLIKENNVMIFSKSYCPYCRRAKTTLDEAQIAYYALELDQHPKGHEIQSLLAQITGQRTVPNVFVKGNHFGGSDTTVAAVQNGRLAELLGVSKREAPAAPAAPAAAEPKAEKKADDLKTVVADLIKDNNVMVFSKSYCPYCRRAKATLDEAKIKYHVVELDQHPQGAQIQNILAEMTKQRTVPNVFVKGKHLGGSDVTVAAVQSGRLAQLLAA